MPREPIIVSAQIIVLADDLSGAAELAGIAFAHGLSAEVRRMGCAQDRRVGPAIEDCAGPPPAVIAIDTDSRHLPPTVAAERVNEITTQVLTNNPAWLFKKTDSVLRGNVRAEIEAILNVTNQSRSLLIPANPSRNRTIQSGQYLIDGVPLDQTSFARDPEHPRKSPDVRVLLGPSTHKPDPILIPDVFTQSDLHDRAAQCDSNTLLAGAADFFETLLSVRVNPFDPSHPCSIASPYPLRAPALLVCGSPAAWQQRQADCKAAEIPIKTINDNPAQPQPFRALLLGIGKSTNPAPLLALAQTAANIIHASNAQTLLAEGGASAAAIAQQMNWQRFQVVATVPAGVGVLRPITNQPAPLFLIKPGSYPWPPEIWQAFCACKN